jgi:hypothetical protein
MPEQMHLLVSEPRKEPLSAAITALQLRGAAPGRATILRGAEARCLCAFHATAKVEPLQDRIYATCSSP